MEAAGVAEATGLGNNNHAALKVVSPHNSFDSEAAPDEESYLFVSEDEIEEPSKQLFEPPFTAPLAPLLVASLSAPPAKVNADIKSREQESVPRRQQQRRLSEMELAEFATTVFIEQEKHVEEDESKVNRSSAGATGVGAGGDGPVYLGDSRRPNGNHKQYSDESNYGLSSLRKRYALKS